MILENTRYLNSKSPIWNLMAKVDKTHYFKKKTHKMSITNTNAISPAELPVEFTGTGQHSGWKFRQVARTDYGYVYVRASEDVSHPYYEAFARKVAKASTREFPNGSVKEYPDRVIYPGDSAFGNWAWCCGTLERAMEILASFERGQS
jgi:hypothetical protein